MNDERLVYDMSLCKSQCKQSLRTNGDLPTCPADGSPDSSFHSISTQVQSSKTVAGRKTCRKLDVCGVRGSAIGTSKLPKPVRDAKPVETRQ